MNEHVLNLTVFDPQKMLRAQQASGRLTGSGLVLNAATSAVGNRINFKPPRTKNRSTTPNASQLKPTYVHEYMKQ